MWIGELLIMCFDENKIKTQHSDMKNINKNKIRC